MVRLDRPADRITLVTVDRPERRNALDHATVEDLLAAVRGAVGDGTRVLVLTGASGHFCSGADLTTLEDSAFAALLRGLLDALADPRLVTMAAIEGAALGAGTQLATACDLRVAAPTARFGIPAGKLGVMVDPRTVQRIVSLAGDGPARAMLLAAEVIDGDAAHRLGLVQRLGDLDDALAWAGQVAELAPLSAAGHKLTLERLVPPPAADPDVEAAYDRAWGSTDLAEGVRAFNEKRSPNFTGT
jgi:enoyl-CoA hydratase